LNQLQAELEASDLFADVPSRRGVIRRAIPKTLVDQVGLDTLLERLPEPYQLCSVFELGRFAFRMSKLLVFTFGVADCFLGPKVYNTVSILAPLTFSISLGTLLNSSLKENLKRTALRFAVAALLFIHCS